MYYFIKVVTETAFPTLITGLNGSGSVVGNGVGTATAPTAKWIVYRSEHPSTAAVEALVASLCTDPQELDVRSANTLADGLAQVRQLALL